MPVGHSKFAKLISVYNYNDYFCYSPSAYLKVSSPSFIYTGKRIVRFSYDFSPMLEISSRRAGLGGPTGRFRAQSTTSVHIKLNDPPLPAKSAPKQGGGGVQIGVGFDQIWTLSERSPLTNRHLGTPKCQNFRAFGAFPPCKSPKFSPAARFDRSPRSELSKKRGGSLRKGGVAQLYLY